MSVINNTDKKYLSKALKVALDSDFQRTHVGCVAVYHGRIIGAEYNTNKTHPMQKYYNGYRNPHSNKYLAPKMHAEINCISSIQNMKIDFSKVKLYVTRYKKDMSFGIARPCVACMKAIKDIGIRHIYYTTDDGFAYERLENTK